MIKITDDSDIGESALSTGYDIRITSSDGTTILAYERESFSIVDSVCNALIWVNVPILSNETDTVLYLYYGKADATDGANKTAVWDSNYKGVWHLSQDPTGSSPQILDSTGNENNGTVAGNAALTAGTIGNALSFDGTGDYISVPDHNSLDIAFQTAGGITMQAWANPTNTELEMGILSKSSNYKMSVLGNGQLKFATFGWTGSGEGNVVNFGQMNSLAITYNRTTLDLIFYINGSSSTTSEYTPNGGVNTTELFFGQLAASTNLFTGIIDEIRISSIDRSAEWLATEYNNQSSPSTFYLIGIEENSTPTIQIYPLIEYNEDTEMFQLPGTSKAHPVQIRNLTTGALAETASNPVFTVYVNGTLSEETVTISAYNSTMCRYLVTVPAALAVNPYDSVEINVSCDEGEGFLMVNIVPAPSLIATAVWSGTEGAAVHTATTSTLTLAAINAEVDTAISDAALATAAGLSGLNNISSADVATACGTALTTFDTATPIAKTSELSGLVVDLSTVTGGGTATLASLETDIALLEITGGSSAEKIVPADKYAFDASAKTLTFSSPYDTLTVEQVTFIKNLTTNYIIWDCRYAGYQTLPIRFGAAPDTHVLSFDSSDSDAANTDKIMIVVNQV